MKPKYKIVEDYILEKIEIGQLKPGDQIETEQQLSQLFSIGRLTVNKAMNNLAKNGYIERIAGKGSFVLSANPTPTLSKNMFASSSFSEDMRSIGKTPGAKLIEYKLIKAKDVPEVADYLELAEDELIHYFVRLRTADAIPIAISYNYVSEKIVHAIDIRSLENSFKEYLRSINIPLSGGSINRMSAHLPTQEQKKLLEVEDVALLLNAHIDYTTDGQPYEYIETYYLCNQYQYTFSTFPK